MDHNISIYSTEFFIYRKIVEFQRQMLNSLVYYDIPKEMYDFKTTNVIKYRR